MENLHSSLPKWILRFLGFICPAALLEEIEGDLEEKYFHDERRYGKAKAGRKLFFNALSYFRPGILFRNRIHASPQILQLMASHFIIASRVMQRNKLFSAINIAGLTVGLAGALLLSLWIANEFTYDQFHADKSRIYKVWNRNVIDGQVQTWDLTPRILAPTLAEEYSSIQVAISLADYNDSYLFTAGNTKLIRNSGVFTDDGFFEVFSFPLLKGNTFEVFKDPSSIVITETFARQLFGDRDAFGEAITISQGGYDFPFTVTGILRDLPSNTDLHFEYLLPFKFLEQLEGRERNWGNNSVATYVKLKKGSDFRSLNTQVRNVVSKHTQAGNKTEIFLYPLEKMHLYSRFENGVPAGGRIEIMRMIGVLGLSLIAIACINFINLSTARAFKRSREVGVRKVTGAGRMHLILQFLCESTLLSLIAGGAAILIGYLLLPFFSNLIQQRLDLVWTDLNFWWKCLACLISIGVLAGIYPAFILSSFEPVRVLKGSVGPGGNAIFRKSLVVFQFGFALTLIFSVIVVRKQIVFLQHRETGYNRTNLIYHPLNGDLGKNYSAYKAELLSSGLVQSISRTSSPITENWSSTFSAQWEGKNPQDNIVINRFYVDENISATAGIALVQGRDMNLEKYASDSSAVLINEAALEVMGFDNPIGQVIRDGDREWHIVGVVKNFVLNSPFEKVPPVMLQGGTGWCSTVHIRINNMNDITVALARISKIFSKYNAEYPFDYAFVDEVYDKKFSTLKKTLLITGIFSSIAIFIACLGLVGLSLYMIESRSKEIGVRKILGGSVLGITKLLCVSSLKPILIGIIVFSPIAWLAMEWWLQSYDYRINLNVVTILLAALTLLVIAFFTVFLQTVDAAKTNPVSKLKSE